MRACFLSTTGHWGFAAHATMQLNSARDGFLDHPITIYYYLFMAIYSWKLWLFWIFQNAQSYVLGISQTEQILFIILYRKIYVSLFIIFEHISFIPNVPPLSVSVCPPYKKEQQPLTDSFTVWFTFTAPICVISSHRRSEQQSSKRQRVLPSRHQI